MGTDDENRLRYLTLTSLDDAIRLMLERFSCTPRTVTVPVQDSCGMITAQAVFSPISYPALHLSAMDGIAVKSQDTLGATDQKPVLLTDGIRVNTGNVIPDGYDAVIMIEDVVIDKGGYLIRSSAHPWQHIRPVGEDIAQTEMIIPRLFQIRPSDIGAMAAYGITEVQTLSLKVALIPTGSEIVPIGTMPRPGEVIESNMYMAKALLTSVGADVTHYPIVPDDQDKIRACVLDAVQDHDLVLISAGSSKGTKDFTAGIIAELGEVYVHGVAIKPAKPVIFGEINNIPVIGMPGYPIACFTILREIVLPLLAGYGFQIPQPDTIPVHVTAAIQSSIGIDEFVPAMVGKINEKWVAVPLSRGSGVQMSLVRSNAYLRIVADSEGLEAGELTPAILSVRQKQADQVVLVTGSHDPVIDYLADMVRDFGIIIASSHVGSMGGLMTLKRGYCHCAPMHLLADNGEYNIPYLEKYIPNQELFLICVAAREQGIVSREGLGFEAITTHRFINRQRGSGTRMLLDHILTQKGIPATSISGYEREVTTHSGVCLSVKSGDTDLGLAVYSAARAFSLSFTPIGVERYEIVTSREMYEKDPRIRAITEVISSQKWKDLLQSLGGYQTHETGVIRRCNKGS
jgi:putative molybdopterin biosynthesis protein